jgi:hypothetical protein
MKLTNYIRDAFIKAAMDDVPSVDYQEQAKKLAQADIHAQVPEDIKKCAKKHPEWFNADARSIEMPRGLTAVQPLLWKVGWDNKPRLSADALTALVDLGVKAEAQRTERNSLERRLRSVAYSATTRKALADLLPEFEKYLPADVPQASRQLPVIAGVVTDFVKAGWPKDKKGGK